MDYTSSGLSWYTWERLKPPSSTILEVNTAESLSSWGLKAGIVGMAIGECQLNNGPETPSSFPNYHTY